MMYMNGVCVMIFTWLFHSLISLTFASSSIGNLSASAPAPLKT